MFLNYKRAVLMYSFILPGLCSYDQQMAPTTRNNQVLCMPKYNNQLLFFSPCLVMRFASPTSTPERMIVPRAYFYTTELSFFNFMES